MVTLAAALPLVGLALVGGPHTGPRPVSLLLATGGGTLALACATTWVAIGRSGRMLDRAPIWLTGTALAAPALWVVWKVIWSAQFEGASDPWAGRPGLRCFALTLALAICPLLLLGAARRGTDPTHPLTRGAALGVATGVYAAAMVDLWCPIGNLSPRSSGARVAGGRSRAGRHRSRASPVGAARPMSDRKLRSHGDT